MKIEVGKWYIVKNSWWQEHPFSVKVVKIGLFRVYCKWYTHDPVFDCDYKDCGYISKHRFICEEKNW